MCPSSAPPGALTVHDSLEPAGDERASSANAATPSLHSEHRPGRRLEPGVAQPHALGGGLV